MESRMPFRDSLLEQTEPDTAEGHLAIDVFETAEALIIKAPLAGVKHEDIEVAITDDYVSIRGNRPDTSHTPLEHYHIQECFWGSFSRHYQFPMPLDSSQAKASLKDSVLVVTIPKPAQARTRTLPIAKS